MPGGITCHFIPRHSFSACFPGIFGENGSGGFIGDVIVQGGGFGIVFGNQQWTFRNITVSNATTFCFQLFWNWAMVFENINLSNCPTGIFFTGTAAGSLSLLDSTFTNIPLGISTSFPQQPTMVLIERLTAVNVGTITNGLPGSTGTLYIPAWRQGPLFGAGIS